MPAFAWVQAYRFVTCPQPVAAIRFPSDGRRNVAKAGDAKVGKYLMRDYLSPERGRAALLTIDAQCDFALPNSPAKVCGTMAAVPAMRRLLDSFRERTQPIVHVVRLYRCDGSNVELCHRAAIEEGQRIVMPGSSGAELVEALKRDKAQRLEPEVLLAGQFQRLGPNEHVMYKPRWSAFYQTTLEEHLRGPGATIYAASNRDFRIVLVTDAVSGTSEVGLRELSQMGVYLMTAEQSLGWLARDSQHAA